MAVGEPGREALAGERDGIGARDPHEVEAEGPGALTEGGLEGRAV
jgi:hypothetical protein